MNDQEYCPECGQENPRDAAFCATCGEQFRTAPPAAVPPSKPSRDTPMEPSRPPRRFKRQYVVYGVIGFCALLIVISAAYVSSQSPIVTSSPTPKPTSSPIAERKPATQNVIDIGQGQPTSAQTPTSRPLSAATQLNR